jgi:predicted RNase H-like nuclease
MSPFVGVDGCRLGWIAVFRDDAQLQYRLFERFAQLLNAMPEAALVLVDIPIGLPWSDCPSRPCDVMARQVLGRRRASSVFPAPSRSAAYATTLEDARIRNLAEVGRSLSAQAWGICAKVAEVDALLQPAPGVRARVKEVHPEVCFWALNGDRAMAHSKSTREGRDERLRVLAKHEPGSAALLSRALSEQRRKAVQCDDVLDALAAYITAAVTTDAVTALRGLPLRDQCDLPMEMLHT